MSVTYFYAALLRSVFSEILSILRNAYPNKQLLSIVKEKSYKQKTIDKCNYANL